MNKLDRKLEKIIHDNFDPDFIFEERFSDDLDFHSLSIMTLRRLMREAYTMGTMAEFDAASSK